MLTSGFESKT